jgi:hypothetical protein
MLDRAVSAVALGVLCISCAGLERADECRSLAKLVNPVLVDIDHQRVVLKGRTYRDIAAKYEALANSTGQIKIRTKHIAEAVNDYQRMLHEAARDARSFADALDAKDETRLLMARGTASRTMRHEATAFSRVDNACRGR